MKETIKSMQGLAEPFLAFLRWEASSGVILLACAILALIVANSPLSESYEHLLHYPIAVFGALRAGLIVVNTNPLYTPREMRHQFKSAGIRALVYLNMFGKR